MASELKYLKVSKTPLESKPDKKGKNLTYLLWGDPVHVKDSNPTDSEWVEVMARNWDSGYLRREDLMDEPILEIYIIDVGQGDGVLFKTPDNKWHLLDAGTTNSRQMTRKGAANFTRFKFIDDLRRDKIELENLILSHPDLDHFGGMIDLLRGELGGHPDFETSAENFYHNGLGRFSAKPKLGTEVEDGEIEDYPFRKYRLSKSPDFYTQLLDSKADFQTHLDEFNDEFHDFIELALQNVKRFQRISQADEYLPGYGTDNSDIQIKILGPIVESFDTNQAGLRKLGSEAKTRNGHSIILRIDYGQIKILLTGDLNENSQKLILNYIEEDEFRVDVAKGCHHGSGDILFDFLKVMNPKATIISSGDNETYAHPQPQVLGASAFYGREYRGKNGKKFPPLLYSTELARSTSLKFPSYVRTRPHSDSPDYTRHEAFNTLIRLKGGSHDRKLKFVPVLEELIFGLVSVRTDGERILIATPKEAGNDFDIKIIEPDS